MSTPDNWQKSSFSGSGDGNACVEVAAASSTFYLRESDEPATVLTTSRPPIAALIGHLRKQ